MRCSSASGAQSLRSHSPPPGFEVDAPRARLLVASGTHRLWGVPMKTPTLRHGAYPEVDPGWRSRRGQVWGLADNGAASIRVQLDSGWIAAKLGRNGFYLELPPSIVAPTQIEVRERSGLRHIYDIKRCTLDSGFPLVGPLGPPPC